MGINEEIGDYEREVLEKMELKYKGLIWCELGNQKHYTGGSAKDYYEDLGVKHTSIDVNERDGSIGLDLDCPIPRDLIGVFDVVTDYGDLEHVNNQYMAFKNTHALCKKGGIMIHFLPAVNSLSHHCRYHYTLDFIKGLSKACNYRLINVGMLKQSGYGEDRNLWGFTFIKITGEDFISEKIFNQIVGVEDSGDLTFTGDYSRRFYSRLCNLWLYIKRKVLKINGEPCGESNFYTEEELNEK